MQITDHLPQFTDTKALMVVSAKEHGIVYRLENGEVNRVEHIEEHPPERSDNEGFFVSSGHGHFYGAVSPEEIDDEENFKKYLRSIAEELDSIIAAENPATVYLFEPEHLKGRLIEALNPKHQPLTVTVKYGNHVGTETETLLGYIQELTNDELSPEDPASVAGEENAAEKRKILNIAQTDEDNKNRDRQ